jgi:cell wall-associated NlpC family hydrolase
MTEQEERQRVVEIARSWLGTPYLHRGNVKKCGADCAWLLIKVFEEAGLVTGVDPGYYPPDWPMHQEHSIYLDWVERYCKPVEKPQAGDIVLYRFGKCISHGAIVSNYPYVIHSLYRQGVVETDLEHGPWASRVAGFWSYWGK